MSEQTPRAMTIDEWAADMAKPPKCGACGRSFAGEEVEVLWDAQSFHGRCLPASARATTPTFTWDDLALLTAAQVACFGDDHYFAAELEPGEYTKGREERIANRYADLAARIAALLPSGGTPNE